VSRVFDPASHDEDSRAGVATAATAIELTTDAVRSTDRLEFWRNTALRRMVPVRFFDSDRPFRGRLRRISGERAELIDHATDAMWADRSQRRCAADGGNDIGIDFMLVCPNATMEHHGETMVRAGDLCLIDYSRPLQVKRSQHRSLALMLRRDKVTEVLGEDLSMLAGKKLPERGIANLLRTHLRHAGDEAMQLSPIEQASAIGAASAMALAALQTLVQGRPDADQVAEGLYIASCEAIARHCVNSEFTPLALATIVGCSRATLYRLFSRHDQSVSAAIWRERLELARRMLRDPAHTWLPIAEIGFRCGFLDQSNFCRMFKRRYGVTPRDMREADSIADF
jgi:AraC family transcriptional regulator, positive regulator of tynA and feaB